MTFKAFIGKLIVFTVILFSIHFILTEYIVIGKGESFYSIYAIYSFLCLITIAIYGLVGFVNKNFADYTGFSFMGGSLFKMFISVVFLLPVLTNEYENKLQQIASFFIPYFLGLNKKNRLIG